MVQQGWWAADSSDDNRRLLAVFPAPRFLRAHSLDFVNNDPYERPDMLQEP
jgi:hypothetical protein